MREKMPQGKVEGEENISQMTVQQLEEFRNKLDDRRKEILHTRIDEDTQEKLGQESIQVADKLKEVEAELARRKERR